ncbi:hypothetical protein ACFFQW_21515 [Umezawaea endophytica]|uniref:Copper(I)-binding protein n=1 Tax=Umezawaea endophytica TaxID=1654476 RepID=A0A9X2VP28_9PSEU|nr:hypothetical protein [Umezawaea endophytica]MCS7478808.1 hypothetical protein [Umezawaea endophytica]
MGRAEQKSRLAVVVALATGLGLAAAGCSAGQITQTDTQVATVDGASGNIGAIAVRNAQFAFPVSGHEYKEGDEAAVVVTIANNATTADKLLSVTGELGAAELSGDVDLEPQTSVASLFAELDRSSSAPSVTLTSAPSGSSSAPSSSASSSSTAGSSVTGSSSAGSSSVTGSSSPTSGVSTSASNRPTSSAAPAKPGKIAIVVKLTKELRPGHTAKVTFLFEKAGPLTLDLPIGADPKPRPEGKSEH